MKKAVFWDRDGVLNMKVDGGSPKQTADVCVFPKASDVLRL